MHSAREGEGVTGSCAFKRGKGEQALVHSASEGEGEQALVHSAREGEGVTGMILSAKLLNPNFLQFFYSRVSSLR
jgi:hypothetical protein